jgi:hypothetical protein
MSIVVSGIGVLSHHDAVDPLATVDWNTDISGSVRVSFAN